MNNAIDNFVNNNIGNLDDRRNNIKNKILFNNDQINNLLANLNLDDNNVKQKNKLKLELHKYFSTCLKTNLNENGKRVTGIKDDVNGIIQKVLGNNQIDTEVITEFCEGIVRNNEEFNNEFIRIGNYDFGNLSENIINNINKFNKKLSKTMADMYSNTY
ncbi:hypothetical protein BCR36DRAFT_368869 [Piromyces finnis]|uniref:Uncharacterized protein n=1 Tax=Piromyces finnis TaxID=1754191 RepID=A0A1Y1VF75_9FUNG|nr:hypothetical protein BCR36DRAFT_368869 [Piromyces finnis]|eukprot:ORX53852.1 hypothetical protein BCR36DRAFT_368869 [Piromyces finnis]